MCDVRGTDDRPGSCGWQSNESQMIAAVGADLYQDYMQGSNPNANSLCGKTIELTYQGKPVHVTAADRCPGCDRDSLDLSPTAFKALADPAEGRLSDATWKFID